MARQSYLASEIHFGWQFVQITHSDPDGVRINLENFHQVLYCGSIS
jgi:hypothetical protein